MIRTTIDVATVEPLTHKEAIYLQAHELECTLVLLRSLDEDGWGAPRPTTERLLSSLAAAPAAQPFVRT